MLTIPASPADVRDLAVRTADAYSADRYASWVACARLLVTVRGYSLREAEAILRSKWMRWAADVQRGPATVAMPTRGALRVLGWHGHDAARAGTGRAGRRNVRGPLTCRVSRSVPCGAMRTAGCFSLTGSAACSKMCISAPAGARRSSCGDWPERPIIIEAAEEAAMLGALPAWEIATPSPRPMGVTCVHGTLDPDNPNDPCLLCAMASAEEMDHA